MIKQTGNKKIDAILNEHSESSGKYHFSSYSKQDLKEALKKLKDHGIMDGRVTAIQNELDQRERYGKKEKEINEQELRDFTIKWNSVCALFGKGPYA